MKSNLAGLGDILMCRLPCSFQGSDECRTQDVEVGTSELPEQPDHHIAADNQGVVMNEIEPSVSERRPSSDTSGV